jgi:transcriptional regulator with XRE-family HTH domain
MEISARLKILMDSKGWDQQILAEKLRVSRRIIPDWLSGKHRPHTKTLERIAETAECSVQWLITGEGEMFPPKTSSEPDVSYTETERSLVDRLASRHGARVDLMVLVSEEEYDFLRLYRKIVAARPEAAKKAVKCLYDLMAEHQIERRKGSVDQASPFGLCRGKPGDDVDQVKNGNTNGE